jgi:hypothetical protein
MLIPGSASQHISRRTQHVRHQPMWFVTTTTEEHHEQQQTTRSRVQQKTRQRGDNPEQEPQKGVKQTEGAPHVGNDNTPVHKHREKRTETNPRLSKHKKETKRHTFQKLISDGQDCGAPITKGYYSSTLCNRSTTSSSSSITRSRSSGG